MKQNPSRWAVLVAALLAPAAGSAQTEPGGVSLHGYLTQGFARAWEHPVQGIPTDGTTDYRAAALQISYELSPVDLVVLQARHRRLGLSALEGEENELRLGWAFYQRSIGPVDIRVGKVPLPRGLFNEIRDVGTALPFYRAPYAFYSETAESMDGVVASFDAALGGNWSMELDALLGRARMEFALQGGGPTGVVRMDVRSGHGGQLWIEPPVPGLRLGVGGVRYRVHGLGPADFQHSWQASGEWLFGPLVARAEYAKMAMPFFTWTTYYGQASIAVRPGLRVNFQAETADLIQSLPPATLALDYSDDQAIGISWALRPTVVLKLEAHRLTGFATDDPVDLAGPATSSRYAIGSFSVGF